MTSDRPVEVEAKLHGSQRAFRALAQAGEIAGWQVGQEHEVYLRDTYWDTPDQRLGRANCTLRVREQNGATEAELTLKGPVAGHRGPALARTELTAAAPAGSGPPEWAGLLSARPIWRVLQEAGVAPDLRPDLVLLNPRRELVLQRDGSEAVVSLDEVRLEGHPYRRRYVEIELRRGPRDVFDWLVEDVADQFRLRPASAPKIQAARAWLARRDRSGQPVARSRAGSINRLHSKP